MGHFSDLSIEKEEDAQKIDAENVLIVRSTVFSVGDIVTTNDRDGVITNIAISMDSSDPAGDQSSAVSVDSYDILLNYKGSVAYVDSAGSNYWCYFNQIEKVEKNPEYNYDSNQSTWCGTEEIEEEEEDDVVVSSSTPQPFFLGS
jgi:hypothetical protein